MRVRHSHTVSWRSYCTAQSPPPGLRAHLVRYIGGRGGRTKQKGKELLCKSSQCLTNCNSRWWAAWRKQAAETAHRREAQIPGRWPWRALKNPAKDFPPSLASWRGGEERAWESTAGPRMERPADSREAKGRTGPWGRGSRVSLCPGVRPPPSPGTSSLPGQTCPNPGEEHS